MTLAVWGRVLNEIFWFKRCKVIGYEIISKLHGMLPGILNSFNHNIICKSQWNDCMDNTVLTA